MGSGTAAAIAGRTLVGWLMPPGSDRRLVSCASHAVQILGSLALMLAAGSDPRAHGRRRAAVRRRHRQHHLAAADDRPGRVQQDRYPARGAADRGHRPGHLCLCGLPLSAPCAACPVPRPPACSSPAAIIQALAMACLPGGAPRPARRLSRVSPRLAPAAPFSRLAAKARKASILGARWARPLVTSCTGKGSASQACSRRTSRPAARSSATW